MLQKFNSQHQIKNLIIAGAPRCGTTSLFNYLNDHPSIFGLDIKETCYFLDKDYFDESFNQTKLLPNYHQYGLNGYDDIFKNAKANQIKLDATPDYIYQETFLKILPQLSTKPLVVFLLREPAERVYSLYKFAKSRLGILSNEISFQQFLDKIRNGNDSDINKHKILKHVIEHSKYVQYINKIRDIVGAEHIHVIINEDFIKAPGFALREICNKLNIDDAFYDEYHFHRYNESYEVKTQFFRKLYEKAPLPYSFRYGDNKLKKFFKRVHHKFNASKNPAKSDGEESLIESLKEEFEDFNIELAEKYGLNLSPWYSTHNLTYLKSNA